MPSQTFTVVSHRIKSAPRLLVWLAVLLATLPLLWAANMLQRQMNALLLIPVYAVVLASALGVIAWREWGEPGVLSLDVGRDRRGALRLGVLVALVSMVAHFTIVWGFGVMQDGGDTMTYIRLGRDLFDSSASRDMNWRTFPVNFLNFVTYTSETPFWGVSLQILLAALAVGLIVYVLARRNRALALIGGLALAIDPLWMTTSRMLTTESLTISMLMIGMVLLVLQSERGSRLSYGAAFAAGLFFAWALYTRIANLPLLVLIALVYTFTISWRKALILLAGAALMLAFFVGFNYWRYRFVGLTQNSSINFDGNLFLAGLYDPHNGPSSAEYYARARECFPDIDSKYGGNVVTFMRNTPDYYLLTRHDQCLAGKFSDAAQRHGILFREALQADPLRYVVNQFAQNSAGISMPFDRGSTLTGMPYLNFMFQPIAQRSRACDWCISQQTTGGLNTDDPLWQGILPLFGYLRQPYLQIGVERNLPHFLGELPIQNWGNNRGERIFRPDDYCTTDQPCISLAPTVAWLLWAGFVLIVSRRQARWLAFMAFMIVHVTIASAAFSYIFQPRYGIPAAPFMLLISIIGWALIAAAARELFTKKGQHA